MPAVGVALSTILCPISSPFPLPFFHQVFSGANFFAGPAAAAGVSYFEWTNSERANTVHHLHFLGADHAQDLESLLSCGSACGGTDVYFSFHINQVRNSQE